MSSGLMAADVTPIVSFKDVPAPQRLPDRAGIHDGWVPAACSPAPLLDAARRRIFRLPPGTARGPVDGPTRAADHGRPGSAPGAGA